MTKAQTKRNEIAQARLSLENYKSRLLGEIDTLQTDLAKFKTAVESEELPETLHKLQKLVVRRYHALERFKEGARRLMILTGM